MQMEHLFAFVGNDLRGRRVHGMMARAWFIPLFDHKVSVMRRDSAARGLAIGVAKAA